MNQALFSGLHSAQVTEHLFNISTIKKQFVRGTTNLEIIAAASLFELAVDVYIATETYRVGFPTWLVYMLPDQYQTDVGCLVSLSPNSITNKRSRIAELLHVSGCHACCILTVLRPCKDKRYHILILVHTLTPAAESF